MALSLIFGKKYAQGQIIPPGGGIVTFDTLVSEEHRFTSKVTYYPIENGTIISDHILNQPDVVVISGVVSDSPLTLFAPYNRSIAAFNALLLMHERRQVVDIVTGIKIYKNMAITSIDVPRTVKTGQTLTFNIELQRIVYDNDIQTVVDPGNIFGGVLDNTPRAIVSANNNIPLIQNDPPFSLKDQAESFVNVGVQSLDPIPVSIIPNVLQNLSAIAGVV